MSLEIGKLQSSNLLNSKMNSDLEKRLKISKECLNSAKQDLETNIKVNFYYMLKYK